MIKWIHFFAAMGICMITSASLSAQTAPAVSSLASLSYEDQMIAAINAERVKEKLPPLIRNEKLMVIAGEWAKTMAAEKRMYHRSRLTPFIKENDWRIMNENISASPSSVDAQSIVSRWMKSSRHRANLLEDDIKWVGVGVATASDGGFYAAFNGSGPFPEK